MKKIIWFLLLVPFICLGATNRFDNIRTGSVTATDVSNTNKFPRGDGTWQTAATPFSGVTGTSNGVAVSGGVVTNFTPPNAETDTLMIVAARGNYTTNSIIVGGTMTGLVVEAGNGITGTSNGTAVASGIVTNFSLLTVPPAAFSPQWVTAANPPDWITPAGVGASTTNIIAPVWVYGRGNSNSLQALGYTTSSNVLNDVSAGCKFCPPFGSTSWGGNTGMAITVYTSTTSALTNKIDFRILSPDGTASFTTNAIVGSAADTLTTIYILTNDLPAFVSCVGTSSWSIDAYFYAGFGATTAVSTVQGNYK